MDQAELMQQLLTVQHALAAGGAASLLGEHSGRVPWIGEVDWDLLEPNTIHAVNMLVPAILPETPNMPNGSATTLCWSSSALAPLPERPPGQWQYHLATFAELSEPQIEQALRLLHHLIPRLTRD
eukprot:2878154-Pyramimonas_sp.AAC.1